MVYAEPVWKQEKLYLGPDSRKLDVLFGPERIGIGHPSSCIPTLVHMSALVGLKTGIYRAAASHCETKHMLYWWALLAPLHLGKLIFGSLSANYPNVKKVTHFLQRRVSWGKFLSLYTAVGRSRRHGQTWLGQSTFSWRNSLHSWSVCILNLWLFAQIKSICFMSFFLTMCSLYTCF